jgi:hypothetical protein
MEIMLQSSLRRQRMLSGILLTMTFTGQPSAIRIFRRL